MLSTWLIQVLRPVVLACLQKPTQPTAIATLQVNKEEEAVGAAMGSPAAAVPAPEAAPPQQKRPSADSISVGKGSLVNLMDEDTEVRVPPSCALVYSRQQVLRSSACMASASAS